MIMVRNPTEFSVSFKVVDIVVSVFVHITICGTITLIICFSGSEADQLPYPASLWILLSPIL